MTYMFSDNVDVNVIHRDRHLEVNRRVIRVVDFAGSLNKHSRISTPEWKKKEELSILDVRSNEDVVVSSPRRIIL